MNHPSHRNFKRKDQAPRVFPTKILTYFIPAPLPRKSGYREKEWDKLLNNLLDQGAELLDIKMAAVSGPDVAGLWVTAVLKIKNPHMNFDFDSTHSSAGQSSGDLTDDDIERDDDTY